jgi:V/A-type H+-transporting ATPase subunit I
MPRYARYWPQRALGHGPAGAPPRQMLADALARIEQWRREADPLIDRLQTLEEEYNRIQLCAEIMNSLGDSPLDFGLLNAMGPLLGKVAAIMPEEAPNPPLDFAALARETPLATGRYLLVICAADAVEALADRIRALGGRLLVPPPWLHGRANDAGRQVRGQSRRLAGEIRELYRRLERLGEIHALQRALGDVNELEWFSQQVGVLELASERFALVTGWTDDIGGARLAEALRRHRSAALIHFPPPPAGAVPPQVLVNPSWVRPFEVFARAMGVPGSNEADPSALLALVVPLLFGYMFGDLGQGLVVFLTGWWLRERLPAARLLMAAGASAMAFGWVFGSVFSIEHLLAPLWLHPLAAPVTVLAVPLGFAVVLLAGGLLLDGLEAHWRGDGRRWLATDAGFLLLYLGLIGAAVAPDLRWLPLPGLIWFVLGAALTGGLPHALGAVGELLERGLQLLVNTLSFARVGAFALAHAGLSSALMSLADAAGGWGMVPVLIVGNLVIIVLEGLVVSIQTTRLVLFEFFTRFLRGEGRVFRPLAPPPTCIQGDSR